MRFEDEYETQTVIGNLSLVSEESWARINECVVELGDEVLEIDPETPCEFRCDSYAVETHVRYPTDVRLSTYIPSC